MAGRDFLADIYTPHFLMALCRGLTDFQSDSALRHFIGQWIRVSGTVEHATSNPTFRAAGVTIAFHSDGEERRDAFLWFTRNLDGLAKVGVGEEIAVEGQIKSVSEHTMTLENCGLADPQTASIMKVTATALALQKAIEDRLASGDPITLKPTLPKSQSNPEPKLDKRKNLPAAEMEKFCKVLLEVWPSTTERVAHPKAVAFFPDNKVPVKAFLDIFRAIRGDRNPGPQPKIRN